MLFYIQNWMNMILCKMRSMILQEKKLVSSVRQEGWRLEHEKTNDPNSPIVLKGVVFNEMKGVFVSNL